MEIEFWGAVIPAGKSLKVDVDEADEIVQVSQVALTANAKPGRTPLVIRSAGGDGEAEEFVLCTLEKGKCDQASLELVVDATFFLYNAGANPLHVTGQRLSDGIDLAGEEADIEKLAARQAMEDTDDDDEEDESEEEDDEDADEDERAAAAAAMDDTDDDDDMEEDEEEEDSEEEEELKAAVGKKGAAKKAASMVEEEAEEDDDSEEEEEEGDDDDEDASEVGRYTSNPVAP
jgi:hypothetical protein